jgi:hypothetical protein
MRKPYLKVLALVMAVLAVLLLSGSALAMSSANYRLDWFVPLTGGGGGPAASANYAANFTVGQSAIGASTSASYSTGLGYWYGVAAFIKNFLPLLLR